MTSFVTTGRGDAGTTRVLSGEQFAKCHPILECTGCLDSARAHLALVRLLIVQANPPGGEEHAAFLLWLLHCCFLMGTAVNDPLRQKPEYRMGEIGPAHLARLEEEQARLEARLELPPAFIVCAANLLAAQVDVTTTVARTFERSLVRLKETLPEFEADALLAFCNRLSDYLYILARTLENGEHHAVDYQLLLNSH